MRQPLPLILFLALVECAFGAQSVTLGWSASPSANAVGYDIYYGSASGNYARSNRVGNVTTTTISNLTEGVTYFFAAKAYDITNSQSAFSSEVSYRVPLPVITNNPPQLPSPPSNLRRLLSPLSAVRKTYALMSPREASLQVNATMFRTVTTYLVWDASTTAGVSYRLYAAGYGIVAQTSGTSVSLPLKANTTFSFTCTAVSVNGESVPSNILVIQTPRKNQSWSATTF
jgi:hypothetical protein